MMMTQADNSPERSRWHIFNAFLAVLQIALLYVIPGSVFVLVAGVLLFTLPFAFMAGNGAAVMVIGNVVLHKAHARGYNTPDNHGAAAAIGATGACIAALIIGFVLSCVFPGNSNQNNGRVSGFWSKNAKSALQQEEEEKTSFATYFVRFLFTVLSSTLTGVIGCAILLHHNNARIDLGGLDVRRSAGAGALGGLVLSIGAVFLAPVFVAAIFLIASPLFIALKMGLKWIFVRSSSSWEQRDDWTRVSRSRSCVCYGVGDGDEEVDAELAKVGH